MLSTLDICFTLAEVPEMQSGLDAGLILSEAGVFCVFRSLVDRLRSRDAKPDTDSSPLEFLLWKVSLQERYSYPDHASRTEHHFGE